MATSSISVPFIQWIASSLLKTYGLDRYKMPFKSYKKHSHAAKYGKGQPQEEANTLQNSLSSTPKKTITNLNNYIKEFTLWAQPEPPFHFLIMDEILRGLCLNRVKPLKSPHPGLLHYSILFGGFFECKHSFTDKPMVITEPAVPCLQLLGY